MTKILTSSFLLIAAATLWMSWQTSITDSWRDKVDPIILQQLSEQSSTDFIIVLKEQATIQAANQFTTKTEKAAYVFEQLQQTAQRTQSNVIAILKSNQRPYRALYITNAIYSSGNLQLVHRIAQLPEIDHLESNQKIRVEESISEEPSSAPRSGATEWGIQMINADDVWQMGYTGQEVVIGGQDTGYDWEHPALKAKYRGWNDSEADHNYNWHDAIHVINELNNDSIPDPSNNPCGLDVTAPCDDHSHGTHTMGTMVGEDGENQIGVAPGARWIGCRNMERGWGSPFTYLECFQWFLAPTDLENKNPDISKAPHVINNSWSCPNVEGCNNSNWATIELAVNNLKASGVVVVVSAGNSGGAGCGSVSTPAAIFENSFTIGATRQNDTIAGFSSRGPVLVDGSMRLKPNVSAPGVGVRSSVLNGGYSNSSGTSMAGPHVAGAVALIIAANPQLAGQVETIETLLEQTAVQKTAVQDSCTADPQAIPNNFYGHGRIDVLAAVNEALTIVNTDTPDLTTAGVQLFPNPFHRTFDVQLEGWEGQVQLQIIDLSGKVVHSEVWSADGNPRKTIAAQLWSAGLYFYQLSNATQSLSGRLVKQ